MKRLAGICLVLALIATLTGMFLKSKESVVGFLLPATQVPDHSTNFGKEVVVAARAQIGVVTSYSGGYHSGGYPPEDTGVCSDTVVRALESAGYPLKDLLDADVIRNPEGYPNLGDSNINFRRVVNLQEYFGRYAESLGVEVLPGDTDNLQTWQAGDIVTYDQIPGGLWHTAIVSNKRRRDGVPYIIHNYGRGTREVDTLLDWPTEITGHYRLFR